MNKIWLIIQREYHNRVRNRAFILLTFLAPLFYGVLLLMPLLATRLGKETKQVMVVDESKKFAGELKSDKRAEFIYPHESFDELKKELRKDDSKVEYILHVPANIDIYDPQGIELLSQQNVGPGFKSYLDSMLASRLTTLKMQAFNLDQSRIDSLKTNVDMKLLVNTDTGLQKSSSGATTAASFVGGFLIYIFIFLYGGLVLRGVQEEKQNRVVEIMISSVKPFQLMMGKIIGIALVGLTQFMIWVLLTLIITAFAGSALTVLQGADAATGVHTQSMIENASGAFNTLPIPLLIGMFVFYFIGGYLLYSSLFAAFAAAVDSQTDIYQFMFPLSLPIVFSITLIPSIVDNPGSPLAVWGSIIPFTSPVIMMARLPFMVNTWEILLSAGLLVAGFIFTTWLAAKIYRTGILMYGKKITYREIAKWLFYRH